MLESFVAVKLKSSRVISRSKSTDMELESSLRRATDAFTWVIWPTLEMKELVDTMDSLNAVLWASWKSEGELNPARATEDVAVTNVYGANVGRGEGRAVGKGVGLPVGFGEGTAEVGLRVGDCE